MFVTTAGRTNIEMIEQAKAVAYELQLPYVERRKKTVTYLQQLRQEDCIVVGKERLDLYSFGEEQPFFFHPNSSMFRIKKLLMGDVDPFVDAAKLVRGSRILDCTLGLASDSIVASYIVGEEGKVVGIEGNRYLSYIVSKGLQTWRTGFDEIDLSLRGVEVVNQYSLDYLKKSESASYDVVYLDPMFEDAIDESVGLKGLRRWAVYADLSDELIHESLRVASKRVVLKDHFRSQRFERYGFNVIRRNSSKFHFGTLEK